MEAFTEVDFPLPSVEELASLSVSSFGYQLPAHQLPVYHRHVCSILLACAGLKKIDLQTAEDLGDGVINSASPSEAVPSASTEDDEDLAEAVVVHQQTPSANIASRSYTPVAAESQENPLSAWTVKCNLSIPASDGPQEFPDKCPLSRPLYGKRVLIKDNIPICGLPMYCGTSFSFTPLADSPLITRCLDAGATIVGKSQCEYMCLSGASHTASAGLVRNPNAPEYHAGGSSSGCAALVFAGEADLSIGCDQGGSCRIPAAMCGVVGCKPTHGLVPYTHIDGMYGPIDHAGPITGTVEDNALMLGVLAGWDGADERPSPAARVQEKVDYCKSLKDGVQGMRVGVVSEALRMPFVQDDVKKAIEDCAQVLRGLGAEVDSISMPLHFTSLGIWVSNALPSLVQSLFYSREKDRLFGVDDHGKVYDRLTFLRENLLKQVSSWSVPFRTSILAGEWLRIRFPESKKVAEVHRQRLVGSYCAALREFDVLLLPTTARKAKKLPTHLSSGAEYEQASAELLGEHAEMGEGMSVFTLCFNVTGHPALTVPVGLGLGGSPPTLLPIGAMLVANYFQEASLYRVGYALEQARHHPPSYTTHGLPPTWRSG